ncbi:MAG TPA: ATP synthase subunit I [Fimbriiglobus sp.]|jgi:hypothetical protein
MNWAVAAGTGFGLGLAYFGGLLLSVRSLRPGSWKRLAAGRTARLGLAAATFYGLLKSGGPVALAAGLGGMSLARWHLVRSNGGPADGR